MPESPPLHDGQTFRYESGSGSVYEFKNVGGVYSCSCMGWRNQSRHPHYRSCKHLCEWRGARDEAQRIAAGGRGNHPSTVERLVAPYWPSTGAASARMNPTPEPDDLIVHGTRVPGGAAMRNPTTPLRARPAATPAAKAAPVPPKAPHNAWTALMDDDHPLAEPPPPAPPPPPPGALTKLGIPSGPPPTKVPANDLTIAKPPLFNEPEWSAKIDASTPLDPSLIISPPPRPVATGGAFRGVLLAQSWDGVQNVTGWIMSEKLDGVRAYWDGTHFYSRQGNVFSVPDWYKEAMPKSIHLDGEFWIGRGMFQKTSGFVRRMDRGDYWKTINYMVFDAPNVDDGFEARLLTIAEKTKLPAHVRLLPHAACPSIEVLKTYLAAIEASGGEGVMLRRPGSRYVRSRSDSLLKVKTFFDTEVTTTGTMPGKGRHAGAVGALQVTAPRTIELCAGKKVCVLTEGTRFEVGTGLSDRQRVPGAIPIGSSVTVRFQELSTDGVPRFPSLVAVRDYE